MEIIKNLEIEEFFDEHSGDAELQQWAEGMFIHKYIELKQDPNGFNFTERELYKPGNEPFFIPGKIYTFQNVMKDKKQYDGQPVVLCTKVGQDAKKGYWMQGINFNNLPPETIVDVLTIYIEDFESELDLMEDAAARNETYISKAIIENFSKTEFVIGMFEKANACAFSKYYLGNMINPTLYEMDDWKYIPFIKPMNLVGMSFADLVKKFMSMTKKMIEKKK